MAKRKSRYAFFLQNDLIVRILFFIDLKQAHRKNTYDATEKKPEEEGQHNGISSPSCILLITPATAVMTGTLTALPAILYSLASESPVSFAF